VPAREIINQRPAMTDKAKRLIAAGLGAVLIALTPGLGTYRAFAATLEGSQAPRVDAVLTPVAPVPGLAAPADGPHAGAPGELTAGGVPSAVPGSQDAAASSKEAAASVSELPTATGAAPAGQAATASDAVEAPAKALDSRALYEAHRLYLRLAASLGGTLSSLRPAGPNLTETTLAQAADARAVLSDLDQTLLRSNAAFDNQLSPEVVAAIEAVHAAGKSVDIVSDRPESVFKSLESLPVETRAGMYVAVDMGGRVYRYDAKGQPVLIRKAREMSAAQKTLLVSAGRSMMGRGIAAVLDESFRPYNYTIRFKVGTPLAQVQSAGRELERRLRALGVDLPVRAKMADHPSNPPYVSVSIITKAQAARFIARARGVKPHEILVLGDAMF